MNKVMKLVKWPVGFVDGLVDNYLMVVVLALMAGLVHGVVPFWAFWGAVGIAGAAVLPVVLTLVSSLVPMLGWLVHNKLTEFPTWVVSTFELVGISTVLALAALAFGFGGWIGYVLVAAALLAWAPLRTRVTKLPVVSWVLP